MNVIYPNSFAYLALLIWPAVALFLYSRFPVGPATLWTILGARLLLPVHVDIKFDMVPAFDKESIPNLAALIGCALFAGRLPKFFRGFGFAEVLIIVLLISPFITSMLNTDPIQIGQTFLPGVGPYDALSAAVAQFIFIVPFFLGRQFLRNSEDNVEVLRVIVIAGLVYSLLILFEVRMGPQLNVWIYGYFPHAQFFQEVRGGSFRPVVFLGHGLSVAFFAMTTTVAAAALWRAQTRVSRWSPGAITGYLGFILVLCRSGASLVYGAALVPLIRWASPRVQLRVASVLVIIALTYPLLRVSDLVPTTSILEVVYAVNTDRAASLQVRFDNEQQLLTRAWQRPWFGWGRFGRSRAYTAEGYDWSITDGYWVIIVGMFGLIGFVGQFALLALPVFRAAMALRFVQSIGESVYLAGLALIVAINIFDLLPNSSCSPWMWLLAGALLGRTEALYAARPQLSQRKVDTSSMQSQNSYSFRN